VPLKLSLQVFRVAVPVDNLLRVGKAHGVDEAGMVQLVAEDNVSLARIVDTMPMFAMYPVGNMRPLR
jgi:hypothetical protein